MFTPPPARRLGAPPPFWPGARSVPTCGRSREHPRRPSQVTFYEVSRKAESPFLVMAPPFAARLV
jgi:hypothetical protein